jgi:hypothetical protein
VAFTKEEAHLIAAAPDLLEALKDVQEELCDWINLSSHNRIRGEDRRSVIKARAAISKALGPSMADGAPTEQVRE